MSEKLARRFHEVYERLAPSYGYETRSETREFDPESPNGELMIRVCGEVCGEAAAEIERLRESCRSLYDENKRLLGGNAGLREEIERLHAACNDLVESAQGGKHGEIICDIDDFNAVEKLLPTNDQEKKA